MIQFTPLNVDAFALRDPRSPLDPVAVFLMDQGGSGRITIACYGDAWTVYFGAIGPVTLREFISTAGPHYLAGKLRSSKHKKTSEGYLLRIVELVQAGIREAHSAGDAP